MIIDRDLFVKVLSELQHPDADGLFVECVDLGEEEPRTIVSGLVGHVDADQLNGSLAVFLCNLKPAKMRGVLSQGMIMCANRFTITVYYPAISHCS